MKEWVQLQRDLYKDIKTEVDLLLKKQPAALLKYEKEFLTDQKDFAATSAREFVSEINKAEVTFFGDFHTLRQSQRLLLRLLRDRKIKRPKILAFEVLSSSHEKLVYQWLEKTSLKSKLQAAQSLKYALNLEKKFGSSFETFQEIFIECFKNKIQIKGLFNPSSSLIERDKAAVRRIQTYKERVWVLFGEYHCARSHLPQQLLKVLPHLSMAVVQQNDDRTALRYLDKLSAEKTLILKSKSKNKIPLFCLLHTPLWVKWQSYMERHLLAAETSGNGEAEIDLREQIIWSLQTLSQFLHDPRYPFRKSESDLLDFEVFGPEDPQFVRSLSKLPASEKQQVMKQLRSSNAAILRQRRRIYLTEQTINSCSQAAGLYLFQIQSNLQPQSEEFFKSVLVEAMAFLMSKLLNHSRQAAHWKDFEVLAKRKNSQQKESRAILHCRSFSVHGLSSEWRKKLKPYQSHCIVALGRMLGDSVFEAFLSGEFSRSRLIRLASSSVKSERDAFERIVELQSIAQDFDPKRSRLW